MRPGYGLASLDGNVGKNLVVLILSWPESGVSKVYSFTC